MSESQESPPTDPETRPLSEAEADVAIRDFLISYPLYRKLILEYAQGIAQPAWPKAIAAYCGDPFCRDLPVTVWQSTEIAQSLPGTRIQYVCAHCGKQSKYFWVTVTALRHYYVNLPGGRVPKGSDRFALIKIGQTPPWSIAIPKEVERALSADALALYRKAIVCMSQAYGIGALAYFRRIVEDAVGALLNLVEEAAEADRDTEAKASVEAARKEHVADEKLRLIAQTIPLSLRPGGVNPFATLYADYSRGLHSLADEDCLGVAMDLRAALEYVFGTVRERLEAAKAYKATITKRAGGQS